MVSLTALSPEWFAAYREHAVAHYAGDQVAAGVWPPGEAWDLAAGDFDDLLPDGAQTKGRFLYQVRDASEEVGTL